MNRLSTDTGQVSDLYIIIILRSPVFLINSPTPYSVSSLCSSYSIKDSDNLYPEVTDLICLVPLI